MFSDVLSKYDIDGLVNISSNINSLGNPSLASELSKIL